VMKGLRVTFFRMVDKMKREQQPARTKELNTELLGEGKVVIDVDYPTFDTADAMEFLDNVGFQRLMMAIRPMCNDPLWKHVVKDYLKKAVYHNVKADKDVKITLHQGVLDVFEVFNRNDNPSGSRIISDYEFSELFMKTLRLKEARKKKDLIEKIIPDRQKELQEIYQAPIHYEVDWHSFVTEDDLNFFDDSACHRINMAGRTLDQKMKDVLKTMLKKIKLKNVKEEKDKLITFSNGVLEMHCVYSKGINGSYSDRDILKAFG